jgi:hypothetical protein
LKLSVTEVVEKDVWILVVSNVEIGIAIVIPIAGYDTDTSVCVGSNLFRIISEATVTQVDPQFVGFPREITWGTSVDFSFGIQALLFDLRRPDSIVGNVKIQVAVILEIEPCSGRAPTAMLETGELGRILEGSVSEVL